MATKVSPRNTLLEGENNGMSKQIAVNSHTAFYHGTSPCVGVGLFPCEQQKHKTIGINVRVLSCVLLLLLSSEG